MQCSMSPYKIIQGGPKMGPLCFMAFNFEGIDQIGTPSMTKTPTTNHFTWQRYALSRAF